MSDLNPVAIILVTSGTRGDRLLFRYPFEETDNLQQAVPSGPAKPQVHNPYAHKISEDRLNSNPNKASAQLIRNGVLVGFEDKTLANLLAVKTTLCGSKFTVKIDDVRFVGFPMQIEHSKYLSATKQPSQVRKIEWCRPRATYDVVVSCLICVFINASVGYLSTAGCR